VEIARATLTLTDLEAHDPAAPLGGRERRFCCPLGDCAAKRVDAGHRSLSLNVQTGAWKCHRCDAAGVLEEHREFVPRRQRMIAQARRAFGLPAVMPAIAGGSTDVQPEKGATEDWRRVVDGAQSVRGTDGGLYLGVRGIPQDVAEAAGVLYCPGFYGRRAVLFPIRDGAGELVGAEGRFVDGRDPKKHRTKQTAGKKSLGLFATAGAFEAERVVITEAPIDALSLAAAGVPAVALCGTSAPAWLPARLAFRSIALALDNDPAGDGAVPKLAAQLASFGAKVERWRPATGSVFVVEDGRSAEQAKDWNDLLRLRGLDAFAAMLAAAWPDDDPDPFPLEPGEDREALAGFAGYLAEQEALDAGDPDLWRDLVDRAAAAAPSLRRVLEDFRQRGCALTRDAEGRIRFGPFDDWRDSAWARESDWWRDYDRHLRPHEEQLRGLLEQIAEPLAAAA
jgi:hypothetical protein